MKARHLRLLRTASLNDAVVFKLVLECWNAEHPHFGGNGPHRYDEGARECGYCFRPVDWVPMNAGVVANDLAAKKERRKQPGHVIKALQKLLKYVEDLDDSSPEYIQAYDSAHKALAREGVRPL